MLAFDCKIISLPAAHILDALGLGERLLSCLLGRHDQRVIHVYLVHAIVQIRPIQLPIDKFPDLIIAHEVAALVLPDQLVYLRLNGHVVFF